LDVHSFPTRRSSDLDYESQTENKRTSEQEQK
jgi:hypothetical protein